MATADLLEQSRWGAMWNAEVEQLNQASAMACISCTSVLDTTDREVIQRVVRLGVMTEELDDRENPASRGTETSAEVLVGPPWQMESNAGQQQRY